jgi:hypothetical protein
MALKIKFCIFVIHKLKRNAFKRKRKFTGY